MPVIMQDELSNIVVLDESCRFHFPVVIFSSTSASAHSIWVFDGRTTLVDYAIGSCRSASRAMHIIDSIS